MQKKLTISINEKVYDGLYQKIGRRRISNFIENLVRPHVIEENGNLDTKRWQRMNYEKNRL